MFRLILTEECCLKNVEGSRQSLSGKYSNDCYRQAPPMNTKTQGQKLELKYIFLNFKVSFPKIFTKEKIVISRWRNPKDTLNQMIKVNITSTRQ